MAFGSDVPEIWKPFGLRDGERSLGIELEMPPLERDERDGPAHGHPIHAEPEDESADE